MSDQPFFRLFERFGVELEYMIVDSSTLDVLPVADDILRAAAGEITNEVRRGRLSWSNELANHVIELKTNGPAPSLDHLHIVFQDHVRQINGILRSMGGTLMPTAMHPWMDPHRETRLWPHDNSEIYDTFNAIFDCRGHGWSNLQSVHLNLPFADDEEFGLLHAAIRFLMPIMPALAASSPIVDRRTTGKLDNRMDVYRTNCARIPSVSGWVIPEPVYSMDEYRQRILRPMYADIAPYDPKGVLQDEWLNARGAIARFERHTIEIRVIDVQECPEADVAIVAAVTAVLKSLAEGRWISLDRLRSWPTESLHAILLQTIEHADEAVLVDADYLAAAGLPRRESTAGDVWRHLLERADPLDRSHHAALRTILDRGTLARRILRETHAGPDRQRLFEVYRELCACLAEGRMFGA